MQRVSFHSLRLPVRSYHKALQDVTESMQEVSPAPHPSPLPVRPSLQSQRILWKKYGSQSLHCIPFPILLCNFLPNSYRNRLYNRRLSVSECRSAQSYPKLPILLSLSHSFVAVETTSRVPFAKYPLPPTLASRVRLFHLPLQSRHSSHASDSGATSL